MRNQDTPIRKLIEDVWEHEGHRCDKCGRRNFSSVDMYSPSDDFEEELCQRCYSMMSTEDYMIWVEECRWRTDVLLQDEHPRIGRCPVCGHGAFCTGITSKRITGVCLQCCHVQRMSWFVFWCKKVGRAICSLTRRQ